MKLFAYKLSTKEQTLFAKRLAYLMRAGVPILDSLNLLKEQIQAKAGKELLRKIVADVANGQYLSTALSKFKNSFSGFFINIIRIGESSGILSDNLEYLAEELKKKDLLRRKILSAMFYPVFIVVATLGLVTLLTVIVFPKVLPIFTSINVPLPLSTRILIVVSKIFINYGWLLLLSLVIFIITFVILLRRPSYKFAFQVFLLKLPLAGSIAKSYQLSNFCRTLGLLLKGDSRLQEAVAITATTMENLVYRRQLELLAVSVSRGEKISTMLSGKKDLFPDLVTHMVAVGETTGNLSDTFLYLAQIYEEDLDDITKNLSSLLEPVLMIFMGLMVGFVAISIITPIYSITQKLHP